MDPYLEALTYGGNFADYTQQPDSSLRYHFQCYTPPDSVNSVTMASSSGPQTDAIVSGHSEVNYDCTPIIASHPGPSRSPMALPTRTSPLMQNTACLSTSLPVTGRTRFASRRHQLTTAQCSQASIEILNPKEEYDKIQRKHGPKGKISQLRISNGQVKVETTLSYYQCETKPLFPERVILTTQLPFLTWFVLSSYNTNIVQSSYVSTSFFSQLLFFFQFPLFFFLFPSHSPRLPPHPSLGMIAFCLTPIALRPCRKANSGFNTDSVFLR